MRRSRVSLIVGTVLALIAPAAPSLASSAPPGSDLTVTGRVVDSAGHGVGNVSVHAARTGQFTLTNSAGQFRLADVPSGSASIIAAKEGYSFSSAIRANSGPVTIRLSRQVTPPRAEYPRPDADRRPFTHNAWETLDGTWSFDFDPNNVGEQQQWYAPDHQYGKAITVPFGYQSLAAFGEQSYATDSIYEGYFANYKGTVWYRREFTVPADFAGQHTRLRLEATNWGAAIWLDGKQVLPYTDSGDAELTADLGALAPGSSHVLAIKVVVPATDGNSPYPFGRQDYFTDSGGIVAPVWIEPVSTVTLNQPQVTPELTFSGTSQTPSSAAAKVAISANGMSTGTAHVVVRDPAGQIAGSAAVALTGGKGTVSIPIANPKLWDINKPNLYTADVTVPGDGMRVTFGLRLVQRKWAPGSDDKYQYIYLNNRPIYIRGVLDQGYNPWGISVPTGVFQGPDLQTGTEQHPGRGSMLYDLESAQRQGFNLIRAHVRIPDPSYLYWADKLGLMVLHEMPNPGRQSFGDKFKQLFSQLTTATVARDSNHPSIVLWDLFNEGWGVAGGPYPLQPDAIPFIKDMVNVVRTGDPDILVNDNSACCENGHTSVTDINDVHSGARGYEQWKAFLDPYSAGVYPGSTAHFDEGTQSGQPWLVSEMAFNRGEQPANVSMMRAYPKLDGYVDVQLADQEFEMVSQETYDRLDRGPEFLDHTGHLRGVSMINGDDAVSILADNPQTITPGQTLSLPISVSHFSSLDLAHAQLHWKVAGYDDLGGWLDPGVGGAKPLAPKQYQVTDAGTVSVTVPASLRVGYVWVWLQNGSKTVAENLLTFDNGASVPAAFDPMKPAGQQWSGGSTVDTSGGSDQIIGYGAGYFDYTANSAINGTLVFEASSAQAPDPVDTIDATGARKYPTKLTVSVNGKNVDAIVLPDDPDDPLGLAAKSHGKYGPGDGNHYGYRVAVPVPKGPVTVRLSSNGGGLRIFGAHAGMLGLAPRIVPQHVSSDVPRAVPTVTDRPSVAVTPAVIGKDGSGTAVVSIVNDTHIAVRNVVARLDLPAGWTVTPVGSANVGTLPPAEFAHVEFTVKTGSSSAPGDVVTETGTALWTDNSGRHVLQADQSQQIEFDPTAFPVVGLDDHFTSDTSANYSTDQPNPCCEVAASLAFGNGLLKASGTPAYYTQVVNKAGPQSDRAVVVVSPRDWATQSPAQDALFLGLVKDSKNYVTAWTGPVLGEASGLDVMVNGTLHGYCCWSLPTAITPGTQWAIAINGNTITTWVNSGSGWLRVVTQDISDSVDLTKPGVIEQYHYAVGFRAQNGDMSISSLTGRSFPGG